MYVAEAHSLLLQSASARRADSLGSTQTPGTAGARKTSRVSLHESQNITHTYAKESGGAPAPPRAPSAMDALQAQGGAPTVAAGAPGGAGSESLDAALREGEAAAAALDFEAAAAGAPMPSMMDVLNAQAAEAKKARGVGAGRGKAQPLDYRSRHRSISVDDETNKVLSMVVDATRVTVNTPPLGFFAAAGARAPPSPRRCAPRVGIQHGVCLRRDVLRCWRRCVAT